MSPSPSPTYTNRDPSGETANRDPPPNIASFAGNETLYRETGSGIGRNQAHRATTVINAARAARLMLKGLHAALTVAAATGAACVVGSVNAGFVNASANLAALSNRSAANSGFKTLRATLLSCSGRPGRWRGGR